MEVKGKPVPRVVLFSTVLQGVLHDYRVLLCVLGVHEAIGPTGLVDLGMRKNLVCDVQHPDPPTKRLMDPSSTI